MSLLQLSKSYSLVGVLTTSLLSACGGTVVIGDEPIDPWVEDYLGTYSDEQCWFGPNADPRFGPYSGVRNYITFSPSGSANTLNVEDTYVYYGYRDITPDIQSAANRCAVKIGSSTAYGEMTYFGSLPSVAFTNGVLPPLLADKFQLTYSSVFSEGLVGPDADDLYDFGSKSRILLALDIDQIYPSNPDSPRDGDGYPTRLDANGVLYRQ